MTQDQVLDALQFGLDVGGFVPGVGEFFDIGNAAISALRKDYLGAALSLIAVVPIAGDVIAKAIKIGRKHKKIVDIVVDVGKQIGTARLQEAHRGLLGFRRELTALPSRLDWFLQVAASRSVIGHLRQAILGLRSQIPSMVAGITGAFDQLMNDIGAALAKITGQPALAMATVGGAGESANTAGRRYWREPPPPADQLRAGTRLTSVTAAMREEIARTAVWKGNELRNHAWDRHPGLAKVGQSGDGGVGGRYELVQVPNEQVYDTRARGVVRTADWVFERSKGPGSAPDLLFVNSQSMWATVVVKTSGGWQMTSFRVQTVRP